jgi:hypothetical protein
MEVIKSKSARHVMEPAAYGILRRSLGSINYLVGSGSAAAAGKRAVRAYTHSRRGPLPTNTAGLNDAQRLVIGANATTAAGRGIE